MKQANDKKTRDAFEPSISEMLYYIQKLSGERTENIRQLEEKIESLKEKGTVNATLHYKAGRYLYLIHPTDNTGNRKREYVGANPEKIKEAQEAVNRYHEAEELKIILSMEKGRMQQAERYLKEAERALGKNW